MLSPDQLQEAGDRVAAVYADIEAQMLDHLVDALINGHALDQRSMTELVLLSQTHTQALQHIIDKNKGAIDTAILETAEKLLKASDDDDIERAGGEPKAPQQIVGTIAGIAEVLARDNLDMVEGAKQAFLSASIEAVTKVNVGHTTTERALHQAVRKLEREGISIISYRNAETGVQTVRNKIDVAVRRHIRTQIAQDGARMTMERMEEMDIQLVEVTSHCDSRPEHAAWQGRCYSLKGDITIGSTRYPDFYQSTQYGSVTGLMGANCRHSFGPYRHGAKRAYEPDPKHPSGVPGSEIYEMEQKQRYLERQIRADKRELRGAQQLYEADKSTENLTAVMKAKGQLSQRQTTMREFIKECNAKGKSGTTILTRKPNREWAGDMPKSATMKSMKQSEPFVKISVKNANGYSISKEVNTSAYRTAFNKIPVAKTVSQSIYEQAGRILQKTDGRNIEHQIAINARTGTLVVDNLARPGTKGHTYFNEDESAKAYACPDTLILIHNHPHSLSPSYRDAMAAATNDAVSGSVVVGHDGSVWYMGGLTKKIADRLERAYNAVADELGERAEIVALDQVTKRAAKLGFTWKKVR